MVRGSEDFKRSQLGHSFKIWASGFTLRTMKWDTWENLRCCTSHMETDLLGAQTLGVPGQEPAF
jgi:hypothetical protein